MIGYCTGIHAHLSPPFLCTHLHLSIVRWVEFEGLHTMPSGTEHDLLLRQLPTRTNRGQNLFPRSVQLYTTGQNEYAHSHCCRRRFSFLLGLCFLPNWTSKSTALISLGSTPPSLWVSKSSSSSFPVYLLSTGGKTDKKRLSKSPRTLFSSVSLRSRSLGSKTGSGSSFNSTSGRLSLGMGRRR